MDDNGTINEKTPLSVLNNGEPVTQCEQQPAEELLSDSATLPREPRTALHRYLVLILICFLSFGLYYCYDNPAALQDQMIRDLRISKHDFMAFYSWYSWPSVILSIFGGFLIDRWCGVRVWAIVFTTLLTGGQIVFALGGLTNKYWLMCVGRFIFGVGGECLEVAQSIYSVKWFKEKELHLVFGLLITVYRVAGVVNLNTMDPIYAAVRQAFYIEGHVALGATLFIASVFCVVSLFCAVALANFDKRNDRVLRKRKKGSGKVIQLRDIKEFPLSIWLMCLIVTGYYAAVYPLIGLAKVFFEMKWDMVPSLANSVNSLVYIISGVATPIGGFIVDKMGRNVFFILLGTVVILGLGMSIFASAVWPIAAYIVPEHMLGTAYGVVQSVLNLGSALAALAAGAIVDYKGYLIVEIFFLLCCCMALFATVWLYLYDSSKNGKLNMSAYERNILQTEEKAAET